MARQITAAARRRAIRYWQAEQADADALIPPPSPAPGLPPIAERDLMEAAVAYAMHGRVPEREAKWLANYLPPVIEDGFGRCFYLVKIGDMDRRDFAAFAILAVAGLARGKWPGIAPVARQFRRSEATMRAKLHRYDDFGITDGWRETFRAYPKGLVRLP